MPVIVFQVKYNNIQYCLGATNLLENALHVQQCAKFPFCCFFCLPSATEPLLLAIFLRNKKADLVV